MKKIPTVFVRDEQDRRYVTREPHPDCAWVFAGEGEPTRKYDGTCTMFDGERWWARREVKPGKQPPPGFVAVDTDPTTGKTQGWEPIESSAFAKFHAEALAGEDGEPIAGQTYELIGPRINGNPEQVHAHLIVRHGHLRPEDRDALAGVGGTYDELAKWLAEHPGWECIVWHCPDGRMAKLKRRDFPNT